jgi:fatty acid desaturase
MARMPIQQTDPEYTQPASRGALDRFFLKFIRDERDLPFVWLSLGISCVLIPFAAALFVPGVFRWWLAPLYWATLFGLFFDRYILMLHCTSHRPLWKREYKFLNFYIPWVLGPFCGETPETYYIHHMTMHHSEGNLVHDLSSTMKYQRDSVVDFAKYWADFFFFSIFKLGAYEARKNRPRLVFWMIAGELSFYAVVAAGLALAPGPTFVVFLMPFLLCRFLMMAGNWGQHAFVDQDDPGSSYKSSITCINNRYNRRCFNDGYHISHHLSASRHWTDHPAELRDNVEKYAAADAVIFRDVDFFGVWFLLMTKNYDKLAELFVDLRDTPRSKEEIIALLKSRTQRIDVTRPDVIAAVPA